MKFKIGDNVIVQLHVNGELVKRERRAVYISSQSKHTANIILKSEPMQYRWCFKLRIKMDYAGTFTIKKARGGFRYNVIGLNNEPITTSEVLEAKQSALDMHESHFRQYRLIDKTKSK